MNKWIKKTPIYIIHSLRVPLCPSFLNIRPFFTKKLHRAKIQQTYRGKKHKAQVYISSLVSAPLHRKTQSPGVHLFTNLCPTPQEDTNHRHSGIPSHLAQRQCSPGLECRWGSGALQTEEPLRATRWTSQWCSSSPRQETDADVLGTPHPGGCSIKCLMNSVTGNNLKLTMAENWCWGACSPHPEGGSVELFVNSVTISWTSWWCSSSWDHGWELV